MAHRKEARLDGTWDIDSATARDRVRPRLIEALDTRFDEEFISAQAAAPHSYDEVIQGLLPLLVEQALERAIKQKDVERLVALTQGANERRQVFRQLLRGPGHPPGRRASTIDREAMFAQASEEVGWALEELRRRCLARTEYSKLEFALEVVAERFRSLGFKMTAAQLRRYREK
jgi:hypothetical protein